MSQAVSQVAGRRSPMAEIGRQTALVLGASLFVAVCAHIYVPLPGTPVPLTVQNLAVLLVGLSLGARRGFTALALYLIEGACGLPVFSPTGNPGILHLFGPTAGYLWAYPFVAALTGYIFNRGKQTFARAFVASLSGELLLFAGGISWLYVLTHSPAKAISFGLYWFVFAEIVKVMLAAGAARIGRGLLPEFGTDDRA